jgi:hypothetical protein
MANEREEPQYFLVKDGDVYHGVKIVKSYHPSQDPNQVEAAQAHQWAKTLFEGENIVGAVKLTIKQADDSSMTHPPI